MKKTIILLFLFLISNLLFANEEFSLFNDNEEDFFKVEEEIVSVVSKYKQKVSQTPAIVSVVTEKQILNSGASTLLEILKSLPGVETFHTQDGQTELAIRGIRGKSNVLFMLNGHRLNSFYDGQSMYNFSTTNIKRIELIRGPGSNIHGTNAFVGVINIITKNDYTGNNVEISTGNWNTLKTSIRTGYKFSDDKFISIFSEYKKSDGSKNKIYENSNNLLDDNFKEGYLMVNYKNKNKSLLVNVISEDKGVYVGQSMLSDPNDEQYNRQTSLLLDYVIDDIQISKNKTLNLKYYLDINNYKKKIYQGEVSGNSSQLGYSKIQYKTNTLGFETQFNWDLSEKQKIVSGIQLEYLQVTDYMMTTNFTKATDFIYSQDLPEPYNIFLFGTGLDKATYHTNYDNYHLLSFPQNTNRVTMGLFIQDEIKFNEKLLATIGTRYDKYSDFGSSINPKIAIVSPWNINYLGDVSFKLGYSSAFRAPTFEELYDRSQIAKKNGANGNSELDPENIKTYEFAVETNYKNKIKSRINFFRNEIKDNIFAQNLMKNNGAAGANDKYENINGIDVDGMEAEIKYDYDKQNYCFANYSWFKATNKGGYIVTQNINGIVRTNYESYQLEVPQIKYNTGITIDGTLFGLIKNKVIGRKFILNVIYTHGSKRHINLLDLTEAGTSYSNDGGRKWEIPAYDIFNISFRTTNSLSKKYKFSFSIYNLTDEKLYDNYLDSAGLSSGIDYTMEKVFKTPGRYFESKLSYKF